jgi:hypothetical protein
LGLGANAKAAQDLSDAAAARKLAEVDEFVKKLPRIRTPTKSSASQYEIKHTGPYNYKLSGGGATFNIDGYRGSTILDAKHVRTPRSSPYIPGSTCPQVVRDEVANDVRRELAKIRTIIKSGSVRLRSSQSRSSPMIHEQKGISKGS